MSHSRVSPSSAAQWICCPGMVDMIKDLVAPPSESAIEGDTAHWLSTQLIVEARQMIGVTAPTGHIIDKDMIDYIVPYATDVHEVLGDNSVQCLHIEQSIQIPQVHAEAHGTPDCWYMDGKNDTLYIWDLKYGWGLIEVFENWQMLMYAIGIIGGAIDAGRRPFTIKMRLVQPRPYHEDGPIREWSLASTDLQPYIDRLRTAAHEALSGSATLCSGSHCRYCLARPTCPADRHASMNAIDVAGIPVGHDILNFDYELDILARAKEIINQRYDALEEHVTELIKNGTIVPGRCIKPTPGRGSTWLKSVEEIVTLGKIFNIDLAKPLAPITPTQAIKAGIPKEMVEGYSERKPSGLKLVKDDQRKVKELLS